MAYNGPTNFPDWTPLDHTLQRRYEKTATLNWGFSNNSGKVSLAVWYNDEAPKDGDKNQRAKIDMSPMTAKVILNAIRLMANGQLEKDAFNIALKSIYSGQQRLDTPRVTARVLVRKQAESGVIGVTIIDGSKPPITFKLLPPENMLEFLDNDKQPISLSDQSKVEALAWVGTIEPIIDYLVACKTEQKKKQKDNNKGGRRNSDHDDYSTSNDDDDIPF